MATWVRNGTGTAPTATDADLVGSYALDNATAPADFDPAGVTSVQLQWTITGSGFGDDSWNDDKGAALVTSGGVELAQFPGGGPTGLKNTSEANDVTDSTGIPTGQTTAAWESAFVRGDGTVIPDEWVTWVKTKGPDGSTLAVSSLTVTITYDPATSSEDYSGTATVSHSSATSASGTKQEAGGDTFPLVQDTVASQFDMSTSDLTITFPQQATEGNLLVVTAFHRPGGTPPIPTGWSQALALFDEPNADWLQILYKESDGTETSVDIGRSDGGVTDGVTAWFGEYSGFSGTPTLDKTSSNGPVDSVTSVSTGTTAALTTAVELAIAAFSGRTFPSFPQSFDSYTNDFTEEGEVGTGNFASNWSLHAAATKETSSTTGVETTATASASGRLMAAVATFYDAGATEDLSGSASTSSASSVSASGTKSASGTVATTSTEASTSTGQGGHQGTAATSVTSSTSASGTKSGRGVVSASSASSTTVVGSAVEARSGTVSVSQSAATSAQGTKAAEGSASTSTDSSVASQGEMGAQGVVTAEHPHSTSTQGTKDASGVASTSSSSSTSATGSSAEGRSGTVSVSQVSSTAAAGTKQGRGVAATSAASSVTAVGEAARDRSGGSSVSGASSTAATGSKSTSGTATSTNGHSITVSGGTAESRSGTISVTASTSTSALGSKSVTGSVSVTHSVDAASQTLSARFGVVAEGVVAQINALGLHGALRALSEALSTSTSASGTTEEVRGAQVSVSAASGTSASGRKGARGSVGIAATASTSGVETTGRFDNVALSNAATVTVFGLEGTPEGFSGVAILTLASSVSVSGTGTLYGATAVEFALERLISKGLPEVEAKRRLQATLRDKAARRRRRRRGSPGRHGRR